jgi:hypothetical protein
VVKPVAAEEFTQTMKLIASYWLTLNQSPLREPRGISRICDPWPPLFA